MVFLWPSLLWLLLILPLLVLLYLWLLRRRKVQALAYPGLALVRQALGSRAQWRRHLPPLLFLLGLAALLLAAARPLAVLKLPSEQQTIILAMDVSGSMRATDVEPDRLTAAQNAARPSSRSCHAMCAWALWPLPERPSWRSCPRKATTTCSRP